jgi:hypothetical protein
LEKYGEAGLIKALYFYRKKWNLPPLPYLEPSNMASS